MTIATEQASLGYKTTWATLAHHLLPPDTLLPVDLSPGSPIVTVASNWLKGPGIWTAKKSKLLQLPFAVFPGMNSMSNIIVGEGDEGIVYAHLSINTTPYGTGGITRVADLIKGILGERGEIDLYHLHEIAPPLFFDLQKSLGDGIKIKQHDLLSLPQMTQKDITGIYANGWFANLLNFDLKNYSDVSGLGKWAEIASDG